MELKNVKQEAEDAHSKLAKLKNYCRDLKTEGKELRVLL